MCKVICLVFNKLVFEGTQRECQIFRSKEKYPFTFNIVDSYGNVLDIPYCI